MVSQLGFCKASLVGVNAERPTFFAKESHYWEDVSARGLLDVDEEVSKYLALFPVEELSKCKAGFVDADPIFDYVAVPKCLEIFAPANLRSEFRFIVVLREPVARDLSWYYHSKAGKLGSNPPCDAWDFDDYEAYADCLLTMDDKTILWRGAYAPQLRNWTQVFPRRHLIVIAMDSLLAPNQTALASITAFLGLTNTNHTINLPHSNLHRLKEQDSISCDIVHRLQTYYDPYNKDLYSQLASDHHQQLAPADEPPFPPFKPFACAPIHQNSSFFPLKF